MMTGSAAKPLRYHQRFQIIPGRHVERDARALARFCRRHGVEEVVLFFAGEEWNNGLLWKREEDRWFDTLRRAKPILERAGVVCSLNPWMTVLHCDRGRRLPADRRLKPMVSPTGEISKACASFADPAWRRYLFNLYGRFATLGFRVIWVEDDFRYHNHNPLTWGGGFEPEVLDRFARQIGRKVSRQAVVAAILKPGKPHPWRARWMQTWRELQLETAKGLAEAVAANAPRPTRLGLMSSSPAAHSIEGRDWRQLFAALTIEGRVAHRPHFAGYQEEIGRGLSRSIILLDVQRNFRPEGCEVAPEVENFPYTRWSKSDSLTWAQMAACMVFGSDALLLNLFPFSGNPADREPEVGELLDRSRPGLEWFSARFPSTLQTQGVGLPWREDAQAHVRTSKGETIPELDAECGQAGYGLLPYGVPVSMRRQPVNAVFGTLAWAFSDTEVREMLEGGLMLDGISADVLCRRGFGPDVGVRVKEWLLRESSLYAIERVARRETGVPVGHYFSMNTIPRVARLEPLRGAREWTTLITPESRRVGAAAVAFANRLGGRVFTLAAPKPFQLGMDFHRQRMLQRAVRFLSNGRFASPFITGGAHLMPIHLAGPGRNVLVIINGSADPARPVIHLPEGFAFRGRATLLAPLAKPVRAGVRREGNALQVVQPIPYLSYLVIE